MWTTKTPGRVFSVESSKTKELDHRLGGFREITNSTASPLPWTLLIDCLAKHKEVTFAVFVFPPRLLFEIISAEASSRPYGCAWWMDLQKWWPELKIKGDRRGDDLSYF